VTNNRATTVRELIRHSGLGRALPVVIGEEDVRVSKPDPQGVFLAIAALEALEANAGRLQPIAAERTVFVGDSLSDAGAATASGVIGVGAGWPAGSIVHAPGNPYGLVCPATDELVEAVRRGRAA
jgi:phosphoglycolate phosphatase-like HAD superfamily hydrolase